MEYQDKILKCAECGEEFPFTAGGQKFFAEMGFTEPRRCKTCRPKRNPEKIHFYKTTCADCWKPIETRLRPDTGRPIYCKDCFFRYHYTVPTSAVPEEATICR